MAALGAWGKHRSFGARPASPRADGGGGADSEEAGAQGSWSSPASSTEPARRVGAGLTASERPGSRRGGVAGGVGGFPAASAAFSRGVTAGAAAQTAGEATSGGLEPPVLSGL